MNTEPRDETGRERDELGDIIASARMHLELERSLGADHAPFRPERVEALRAKRRERAAAPAEPVAAPPAPQKPSLSAAGKAAALEELRRELGPCCLCGMGRDRKHLVFGVGRPDADLMFVGEAPGFHEDQQGIPFVGPAGQLLTKIIEAIGLARDEVYIANIVKCRPPENRLPLPDEVARCLPHLRRQIEIIRPRILVTLGNLATQTLLQTAVGITKARGIFTERDGILFLPTFHPSYLLRNPAAKKEVWEDMKKVWAKMNELGLKVGELKAGR